MEEASSHFLLLKAENVHFPPSIASPSLTGAARAPPPVSDFACQLKKKNTNHTTTKKRHLTILRTEHSCIQ